MKNVIAILAVALVSIQANAECLTESSLRALDAGFEHALATLDFSYLERELDRNFVWVHDHAGMIQRSRMEVIEFLRAVSGGRPPSQKRMRRNVRTQRDVRVLISAGTGVVYGFTDVSRGGQELTYHFMRTYTEVGGKCVLMANQTMAIPRE